MAAIRQQMLGQQAMKQADVRFNALTYLADKGDKCAVEEIRKLAFQSQPFNFVDIGEDNDADDGQSSATPSSWHSSSHGSDVCNTPSV